MLVGFVFLFSCKKDNSKGTNSPGQKYTVNFTVSDVTKAAASTNKLQVTSAADTFSKYAKNLRYLVYDSNNQLVRQINQDTTTANFGHISDSFTPGTYNVVFIVNAGSVVAGQPVATQGKPDYFTGSLKYNGLFYKSTSLTVTNTTINQQIALNRINAQVQVKATDVVPAVLDSVQFSFSGFQGTYAVRDGAFTIDLTISPRIFGHVFTAAEKGTSNFKFSTYCFNTVQPFTVKIIRYGKTVTSTPITVNNVTSVQNKVTVLTGQIFQNLNSSTNQNAGFQISFDPNWNDQIINY